MKNGSPERTPLKDKLSLIISFIALLLSIAGFLHPVYRTYDQEIKAQHRARAHAYNLGVLFTLTYMGYTRIPEGSPEEIDKTRESMKYMFDLSTREIMAALKLDQKLNDYFVKPKSGDIDDRFVFGSLRQRIAAVNTEETVAAYNVGHGLAYLAMESEYARRIGKQKEFIDYTYPTYCIEVERNLKILGIDDELPRSNNAENVTYDMRKMVDKYKVELSGGQ